MKRFKILRRSILIYFILFAHIIFAENTYPVRWTSEVKLTSISQIPTLLASKTYVDSAVDYINSSNQHYQVETCNDYVKYNKAGYYPSNNMQIAANSFFVEACEALIRLQSAQSAKTSYLRHFNIKHDYGELPASLIFPSIDGPQPKGNLLSAFPDTKVVKDDPNNKYVNNVNTIGVESEVANLETFVTVLGWGDFDHNGFDEMLLSISTYSYHFARTYHTYETALISKYSLNGPIMIEHERIF